MDFMKANFKDGDKVLRKPNCDKVLTIEKAEYFFHEAFTHGYIKIEGDDKPYNQEDFVKVDSIKELLHYLGLGFMNTVSLIGVLCCIVMLVLWLSQLL